MNIAVSTTGAEGVVWDLSVFYSSPTDPKIDETWTDCHARVDAFTQKYRGNIGSLSPLDLANALRELESIQQDAAKPINFAGLLFAADTSDPQLGGFYQEQNEKSSELRSKLIFTDLELQNICEEDIQKLLDDPALANYRHYIGLVRAYTPYMLTEREETLLEQTSNTGSRAWVRLHEEITANHVYKYTDPHSGDVAEFSLEEVIDKLRHEDRAIRQAAADSMSAGLRELNRVIVFTYNTLLADKRLGDRLRKMEFAEQSRHLANELDKETVDLVMKLCRERSDLVERYYNVKKQILGLDELTHIDRYAPLFESQEKISWEKARDMILDAFGAYHPELEVRAKEFFDKNWIDAEVRKGKSGGAFCNFNTADTHPVMLMTYQGGLNDVMTLAHELGHCVHASLSRKQTEFNFHGTLPLAELASIFGEQQVFDRVVQTATLKDQIALYADKIEGIFASVHRQAAMFRFEQRCHEKRRNEGELSSEDFAEIWQDEIQSMFGKAVTMGDQHKDWWSYVSHFFFAPFYVYAYSFGELLTLALYQMSQEQGPEFADKYVKVLELGGSQTPHELMAHLGVDLRSEEFWQGGFSAIEAMVKKFETLWAEYSA